MNIDAVEVTQSLQTLGDDRLPLCADRDAVVRVYFSVAGDTFPDVRVHVRLIAVDGEHEHDLGWSLAPVSVRDTAHLSLGERRARWSATLNHRVGARYVLPGNLVIKVAEAETVGVLRPPRRPAIATSKSYPVPLRGGLQQITPVDPATTLNLRIVRFRYRDHDNNTIAPPPAGSVRPIVDWVRRAFPVSRVSATHIALDADRDFFALPPVRRRIERTRRRAQRQMSHLLRQLLAIRNQDIHLPDASFAADTLYLAVIDDPNHRLGGLAMDAPQTSSPHVVALATVDGDGVTGAHEIAHCLGLLHPGIPLDKSDTLVGGQSDEDHDEDKQARPPFGLLGKVDGVSAGDTHYGLDIGPARARVLAPREHFDVMTYRDPRWVSSFSYNRLRDRFRDRLIDQLERLDDDEAREQEREPARSQEGWTVIGSYDTKRRRGRIEYLLPSTDPADKESDGVDAAVRLEWRSANLGAVVRPTGATRGYAVSTTSEPVEDQDGSFGSFLATVTRSADNAADGLGLRVGGRLDDVYVARTLTDEFKNEEEFKWALILRAGGPLEHVPMKLAYDIEQGDFALEYRWPDMQARCTTTVQIRESAADGSPWMTVAVSNRLANKVWLSPEFFAQSVAPERVPVSQPRALTLEEVERTTLDTRIFVQVGFNTVVEKQITFRCQFDRSSDFPCNYVSRRSDRRFKPMR